MAKTDDEISPARSTPAHRLESVDNALNLMLMLRARKYLRVSEAARELGVAPSTAHRLLAALCLRGFAERDDNRVYRAGPALGLGEWQHLPYEGIQSAARPYLERISEETGETVHLMVRDQANVLFLDGVESAQTLRVGLRTGRVLPAHCTAGGKALLAALSADDLAALYPHGLPDWPGSVIHDLPTLHRRLARVRQQGFAVHKGESEHGIAAVGIRLHTGSSPAFAAVSVVAPEIRADRRWVSSVGATLLSRVGDLNSAL